MTKINGDLYIGETGFQLKNPEALTRRLLGVDQILSRKYSGTGKNINNYKTAGQYGFYGNNTNAPVNNFSVLEVVVYSDDWLLQRWTDITNGAMFERRFTNATTWSAWVQRW